MLWKIQEDQSYYQKIYTFLSGSFCTSLSSKKQVRELSRQDLREISLKLQVQIEPKIASSN